MYVADGPVGVVRQRVDGLDGHHRAFEGGHAVEGQRHHQETQHRIGAQLMPGAGKGHHAVDHAAPAGREQDHRHRHAQALRPIRQCGVVQVMRAGPDVQGDDRPEMHDGQAIGIDRPLGLLRHEVIHDAEKAHREDEAHHTVPIPPLDHRVGGAGIDRVGLHQAHRHQRVVDHVHHAGDDDEGAEEPVAHVDVADLAIRDSAEEQVGIGQPDQGHPGGDRPFHLRVFLGGGVAQRVADHHGDARGLPGPEDELAEAIGDQANTAGALHHIE